MDWTSILLALAGLAGLLVIFQVYIRKFKKDYWADKNLPSVRPQFFLLFINLFSKKQYWEIEADWCREKGRVFGGTQMGEPCLTVADPEILRRILVKDFHYFVDRRIFDLNDPIGNCFLTILAGDDWKRVRSVITPAFATGKLKKLVALMDECAAATTDTLIKTADEEGIVDCKSIFGGFTLDIIANTAFGTKLNSAQDPNNIFVQHAKQFFNITIPWRVMFVFLLPRLTKLLGISALKPKVMNFFVNVTNAAVQKRKETKEDRGDFLQSLIEAEMRGSKEAEQLSEEGSTEKEKPSEECQSFLKNYIKNKTLTPEEFAGTCIMFFLGGYDSTATTVSMTTYYLALNPDCQAKVLQEVDEIWEKYPTLDSEALSKMKYLEAAISETLRLAPPAPRVERKAMQDYHIEEVNFTVPKDMVVGVPIYAMHQDPEFFPDPEKYDPERFLPENKESIKPYTYLPFGAGPRNCLGMRFAMMEMKICFLHVFREVTFEPCEKTKIPPEIYRGSGLYQPKAVNLKVIRRRK